jgi:hypothetical protein
MKIRQINYDQKDDAEIKDITVTMTLNEAVALVNLAGKLNGTAQRKLQLGPDESLYDALNGVFNQHYEDGVPELNGIDLKAINGDES